MQYRDWVLGKILLWRYVRTGKHTHKNERHFPFRPFSLLQSLIQYVRSGLIWHDAKNMLLNEWIGCDKFYLETVIEPLLTFLVEMHTVNTQS